jgi:hypothetical protein
MTPSRQWARGVLLCAAGVFSTADVWLAAEPVLDRRLSFDVAEGQNLNSFIRAGPVAAHLVLRSGTDPRILVAFPAGNSGVGLWFSHMQQPVIWALQGRPQPIRADDEKGRVLYGVIANATVTAAGLSFKQAVLSSVRVLRDYQTLGSVPAEVLTDPVYHNNSVTWKRERLDGAAGYRLTLVVTHGAMREGRITAAKDGTIGLQVTALSGETPLTAFAEGVTTKRAQMDRAALNTLAFLSYREKFLAGSWRFNTYFGRDTLMSVRLLMPVLTPEAVEAALGAVLVRLSATGEVAHEEDIGEFAVLDHLRTDGLKSDAPVFDYKMIDGNYMLAPVAAAWLLDDDRGRSRAAAFLAATDGRYGGSPAAVGADLVLNLRYVIHSAEAFADDPQAAHLIGLKSGFMVGQWRDSNEGLGRGRYPFDVNAVFVPAALEAASRFYSSGLLEPYINSDDRVMFSRVAAMAAVWRDKSGPLFEVEVPNAAARAAIISYAESLAISSTDALKSIGDAPVRFHALSLDGEFRPVPIVNSDEGFELLFGNPSAADLVQSVAAVMRPFPTGLLTDVGVVVANPVFATPELQSRFTKNAYHGTVIWSWQQAVLAAGFERQLRRDELPNPIKERLQIAQKALWRAIDGGKAVRNSELWSWNYAGGHFSVAPFGASGADADESNAAQLWSTVYLAIPAPVN